MASELILKPKLLVNCAVKEFSVIDYILMENLLHFTEFPAIFFNEI